jgi:hypothetical protein
MTDEELTRALRASLRSAVAGAQPAHDLILRLQAELADTRRGQNKWSIGRLRSPAASWSRRLSVLAVAASCATVLAIAALAILTLRHRPSSHPHITTGTSHRPPGKAPPQPGPIPHNVHNGAIPAAYNATWKIDPSCGPGSRTTGGKASQGSPSSSLLRTLPVLTRAATAADRLPSSLFSRGQAVFSQGGIVYVRYVRRVREAYDRTLYLVPEGDIGRVPLSVAAADHCYQLLASALRARLGRVPRSERAATLRYGLSDFAEARWNLMTSSVHEGVALVEEDPGGATGASEAASPTTIRQTGLLGGGGGGSANATTVMDGIVPAGVATVTLTFPATHYRGQRLPALSVTGNVIDNVFVVPIPTLFERGAWPNTAIWRSTSGAIIKTINEVPFHP